MKSFKSLKTCAAIFSIAVLTTSTMNVSYAKSILSPDYITNVYKETNELLNEYKENKQKENADTVQQLVESGKQKAQLIAEEKARKEKEELEKKINDTFEEARKNEEISEIPYLAQSDPRWGYKPYYYNFGGSNTLAASACGPSSFAMVVSYLSDEMIYPYETLMDGDYHVSGGTANTYFPAAAEEFGIGEVITTYDWDEVVEALNNNQPVISLQDSRGQFTNQGHFIVLRGITEDGNILVHDPNGSHSDFSNREFSEYEILVGDNGFFIFENKDDLTLEKITAELTK